MGLLKALRRSKQARSRVQHAPNATTTTSPTTADTPAPTTATTTAATRRLPEAIPCHNYYDIFPEDAGPMGHVVIEEPADMRVWKLIAKPISSEEAEKKGGCIQYVAGSLESKPRYYEFTHDAEAVYGTASYQKVLPESPVTSDYVDAKAFPANKHVEVNTSYGGLSDEGLTDAQTLVA